MLSSKTKNSCIYIVIGLIYSFPVWILLIIIKYQSYERIIILSPSLNWKLNNFSMHIFFLPFYSFTYFLYPKFMMKRMLYVLFSKQKVCFKRVMTWCNQIRYLHESSKYWVDIHKFILYELSMTQTRTVLFFEG